MTAEQLIGELTAKKAELTDSLTKAEQERDAYKKLFELSREECERLKSGLVGQKAERLPADVKQLSLAVLGLAMASAQTEESAPTQAVASHERKKPTGRKPLPESLPAVRIELLPTEVEREGTDAFERIGEELTEVLERRPASLVRVQVVRGKFVRKDRERGQATDVFAHEPAELPIERGLAGPGMLADTIVRRWDDHAPLNRLERIYGRDGLELARSTMCTWHTELAELCRPLMAAMLADALTQPYLCIDATGVLVQAKEKCRSAHFWVLVAPERHVLFRFSHKHDSAAVDALLKGYHGYLVADAHSVYDHLYKDGEIVESGCWSHARRYMFKSLESDPERAKVALALLAKLFAIERTIADAPRKQRESVRDKSSRPIVERYFAWCREEAEHVLDESPIAKGIGYARNQELALKRFLDDGRLPMHNNISERELRREAVGRKNWLFVGSDDGALANTTFVSLLASCRLHGVEPWSYLRDLFCLLPTWPSRRVLELAPANWRATLEDEETQRRLEANIFRRVTMLSPPSHDGGE